MKLSRFLMVGLGMMALTVFAIVFAAPALIAPLATEPIFSAAALLAEPTSALNVLAAAIIVFAVLAMGFALVRRFVERKSYSPVLAREGWGGLGREGWFHPPLTPT